MSKHKSVSQTTADGSLSRNVSSLVGALLIAAPGLSLFFIDIEHADYRYEFAIASVIMGGLLIAGLYFLRNQAKSGLKAVLGATIIFGLLLLAGYVIYYLILTSLVGMTLYRF